MRGVLGLIGPRITALAIALPIAAAAAAATTAASVVAPRLFAALTRFGCKATGCFDHGFILRRLVSLRSLVIGPVMDRLGDCNRLDMRLGMVMQVFATTTPAPALSTSGKLHPGESTTAG